ncbi:MAG: hypothetical protein U0871_27215 [Gemmataceae bacterium]
MSVVLREIAGWVLLGVGLAAFGVCYFVFLLQKRVVEGAALGVIGFVIFRGGLHLLKVAIAARAAAEAGRQPLTANPARAISLPLGQQATPGRPRPTVVPGQPADR